MMPRLDLRPGLVSSRLLCPAVCVLLASLWLWPSTARADFGCGESGMVVIDDSSCGESGVFAIDNRFAPADFDHDGDVDSVDHAVLEYCFSGPAVAYWSECAEADLNHDGSVDLKDFAIFQQCFSGSGRPANPDCAK